MEDSVAESSPKTTIRRHFLLAHYDDGTAYRCPAAACGSVFQARHIFRQHINSKHRDMTGIDYDGCRVKNGHFVGNL